MLICFWHDLMVEDIDDNIRMPHNLKLGLSLHLFWSRCLQIKQIFMSINLLSSNIVCDIRERLLGKINKLIAKRAALFANMNLYSVDQLSKLIEEVNKQLVITVTQARILDVQDVSSIPTDNLMAICDSKSLLQPTLVTDDNNSLASSKVADGYRKRRLSHIGRAERSDSIDPSKALTFHQNNGTFVPLRNGDGEQDSRQIEAYREMKKKEFEDRAKKLAHEIHNKQRVPINLNVEDVMYDFEGQLTKLDKSKERKFKSVPQVMAGLRQYEYDQKKKRRRMLELANRNIPISILEKTNVTVRDLQAQKEKKNRQRSYTKSSAHAEEEGMVGLVKVNLDSHKQIEEAISVREQGVKITIKQREFSSEKETAKALTKITKRLSRSEYIQFKSDEEKKKIIKNSAYRFIEKAKPKAEQVKPETVKLEVKPVIEEERPNHRLSLILDNDSSSRDKSRIFIHSLLGKAQLIKQVKHKAYLTEQNQQPSTRRDSLSTVDKYNLLYVKYNGNPPEATYENITKQLQTQRKQLQKIKDNTLKIHSNKKQSFIRENRLITTRMS